MKVVTFISLLLVLGFIQESFQYGTIFTDNITPAFQLSTYFQGIKTEKAFSTDSDIGVIGASNLLGFTVSTPGPLTTNSDTFSVTGSHEVNFGGSQTDVTVHTDGDFTTTSQRTSISGGAVNFAGTGNVFVGGLDSTLQAGEFTFTAAEDISLRATGDVLRVVAPVSIEFSMSRDGILNAERNIQIVSDTSDISFTAFNNFDVTSNHIDIDGSDLLSIVVDNDIALAAGSIIEFLPVGAFEAQVDDLDVTVSSGDIQLIASSRIHFHGNESRSSFKIVAQDDVFFTLKSTSEATMAVICGDDVTIRATEQITFASFLDQSDLSLAAFDKINHTAPIIELTTINGTSIAGGKLSTSARDYVLFEVLNEDLTATAINGPISFTAGGNFSVATNNDFVAEAVNIYQKTNNDIQIFARNILVKQDNIDTNGVITVNVDTDIDVSTGALLFATAGDHIWTIQGDSTVTADNDITFRAAKGYENDLVFSVNGNTTISATDIDYTSAVIKISATDYIARTQDDYRIFSQNDIRFNTQGQFIAVADDVSFDSQYGDLTFRITGDSALTTTNGDFSHNAFKFEFEADSIVYNADDAQVEIQSQLTAEISGNAYWQTTTFELVASATVQILADTFNFQSNDDAIFTVGQAVQLSQNYPGDYFQITTGEFNIFADSSIDILSGRNLNFIATNVNIDESVSSHYAAQETLDIRTDTLNINTQSSASFISGGKLLFSSGNTIDLSSEDEFFITGSTGQFGLTSFRANDIIVSTRNDPVSGFINMSAEDITFDATNSFYEENFDALEITVPFPRVQDEARSKFYGNTLQIVAPQSISASSDFVNFYANALNQEATDFTLTASNILKITTPLFQTTFDDMTLQAPAITWNGEDLKLISDQPGRFNADSDLNGVGDFEGYSGVDFLYKVDNAFTISAPIINVDSEDLLSIISLTDISFGFDNTISFLSGGKTTWDIAGDISYTANDLATIQSFYTSISTTADIQFTAQQSNILLQAADGFAKFQGNDYMTLFSGQQSLFQAGNNIITNSQVFYSANSYNGLTSTLTNDVGFSATARAPDGNVVFDALAGGIQGIFQENEHYRTNAYTNVVGATGVSWTAVQDITTTVFKDFNVSSIANTKFTTLGDFTHKVAKYANYQSRNAYVLDADQDFLLSAATDLLVSTGEQGQLDFTSLANLDVVTTSFQHWRSSDSFAVTSANNGIVFNSHVTDILVNTFGGQISLESPTGGHYLDVAGQNMQMFSGDFTKITSSSDQSWSAATQLRGLAKGDVFFDGLNTGSFQFTSENQNRWNADGTRFDEDGISFTTPVLTQFGASTASFNPALTLQFGGKTRPVLDFATGGSSTQAGYILQSQGNIYIASETANFDAASNYYVNTFKDTSYSSDAELSLEATTGAVTLLSDAGNLKFFAETLTSTATTAYSLTATSGVFEILSSSRNPLAKTYFEADSTITTTSSTWAFVSGSTKQSANSARYATTTSAKFLSVDGSDGSLSFYGNTLNQLSSRGAITIHTLGQDGNLLVQAGTLDVTTKVSSDITFKAASLYKQGSASTTTYSAGTSLNFIAESVINQDYTKGDIRFFAGGDISIKSADTMSFSAFADISIQADAQISATSTGDIALNSFDDTILSVTSAFTSSSTGLLTFENTPGSGGDWNVISSQPSDSTTYQTGHDVTFDMGGNIIGHTAENLFYKSLDSNGQDIAQVYTTTAPGGNIKLSSSANTQLRAFSNVQIDSNGPLSVLGYLNTQFSANGVANQQSFTFNSTQGSIMYTSLLGSVTSQAQGQFRLTATGNLELTANGISRDSSSGISVSAPQGSTTFGAGDSITVSAHEAITFGLDHLGARFLIGASRFIDFGAAGNGVARTSTTLFKATGHEADIVLNLRESRDGIGYLRFLAGSVDPLEDYKSANGVVDIFATESIRFEQNSGFTWAGVYPATFTQVTGSTSLSPSDIFFNADGEHSSIEVGTTKEALLANINVLTQALILEADGKMTIATFGEAGSSVEFISKQEAIKVQSFSQSENDGVFLTSYNGDITMVAAGFGEIHLEPERNLLLTSHRGFDISTDSINMIEPSSTFLVRVTDGDINLNYGTLTVVTLNDIEITTFQPTNPTGQNIYFEAPDLIFEAFDDVSISASNLGNIYFRFYSLADFSGVDEVIFTHPSSVAIPMRESDLAPGQQCSIPGELVIFRDMDFFNAYSPYTTQLDSDNDSGVQICFCMRSRIWACRILSNAQPFSQPP